MSITLANNRIPKIAPGTLLQNTETLRYLGVTPPGINFAEEHQAGRYYWMQDLWDRLFRGNDAWNQLLPTVAPGGLLTVLQASQPRMDMTWYLVELLEPQIGRIYVTGSFYADPHFKMIVDPSFPP